MTPLNDPIIALTTALAWPVVTVIAVLVLALIVKRTMDDGRGYSRSAVGRGGIRIKATVDLLDGLLDGAIALNAQCAHREVDPAVHLVGALRISPVDFTSSALEIGRAVRMGKVTIVDFAQLEIEDARRLVDFCGGLACHAAAWLFRSSGTTLIVTPPHRS